MGGEICYEIIGSLVVFPLNFYSERNRTANFGLSYFIALLHVAGIVPSVR